MKLNVGLIGIGSDWENLHRPALKTLSDRFEVGGVCSEISVKSAKVASDFNTKAYDGYRALIRQNHIDAVMCLSRDWVGALPMLAACDYGKAIYSSSALDMDADRAGLIKQRVEESGVAFMAEFAKRHTPATIRLKELIATRLGAPRMIFCTERLPQLKEARPDRPQPCDEKLLLELVDWCSYIIGSPPQNAQCVRHAYPSVNGESEFQQVNLGYHSESESSAKAQINISRIVPVNWKDALGYRRPAGLQVCCQNGVAYIDSPTTIIWFDDAGQHTESLESDRPVGEQLLTLFHRAVTSLIRKTNDLEDAFRARVIVEKINSLCESDSVIDL